MQGHLPSRPPGPEPLKKKAKSVSNQVAIAMELPFTLVGAVILGGALGYLLDIWLHTGPWLMIILGGLGFFAGVREVIRRLPLDKDGTSNGPKPR
jgi:F0F1-type ATP synthase assembly protein I